MRTAIVNGNRTENWCAFRRHIPHNLVECELWNHFLTRRARTDSRGNALHVYDTHFCGICGAGVENGWREQQLGAYNVASQLHSSTAANHFNVSDEIQTVYILQKPGMATNVVDLWHNLRNISLAESVDANVSACCQQPQPMPPLIAMRAHIPP